MEKCFYTGLFLGFLGFLIGMFYFWVLMKFFNGCKHDWKLIDDFTIRDGKKDYVVGVGKLYECEHCKEMKTVRSDKL